MNYTAWSEHVAASPQKIKKKIKMGDANTADSMCHPP